MGRLVVVLLGIAAALVLLDVVSLRSLAPGGRLGTRVEGRSVVRDMKDFEVGFTRQEDLSEAYMVFGGDAKQRVNGFTHASVAALPIREARWIAQRHPDFHRCASPGAKLAKDRVEAMSFVAADGAARDALSEAVELHEDRLREDGDRTCFRVNGARLEIESIRVKHDGQDVTRRFAKPLARTDFYLAEHVELEDCAALLR
jgi:hypothetical protein